LWLAPVQAAIIPVAPDHEKAATELGMELLSKGIRVVEMHADDSLGKRIRDGEMQRIPYLLVMGDKEIADKTVTVRNVRTKKQVTVPVEEFIATTSNDVAQRKVEPSIG
jgi:threonyl-tRNA synthetase